MTTRPEKRKLASVTDGGSDSNTPIDISVEVNGTTNTEKERPKKRPSTLKNPTITTATDMMGGDYSSAPTSAGSYTTGTTATIENINRAGAKASEDPHSVTTTNPLANTAGAFLPPDALSRYVGGGGGASRLRKVWTVVETSTAIGNNNNDPPSVDTNHLISNAAGVFLPQDVSSRADVGDGGGTSRLKKRWTVVEEKKLASAVETFGTNKWAKVAANVPGRNKSQCYTKWYYLSRMAASTTSGTWTVEEEKQLVSAVATFGTVSWDNVAAHVPGRSEKQCTSKWGEMSKKVAATARGTWTVKEEKKLVSAVEAFGNTGWANVAVNVPGRSEIQCQGKWWRIFRKAAATTSVTGTVKEEKKLVSAVETFGNTGWANVAANVPGRSEIQCCQEWQYLSKKTVATARGNWTVKEEKKLVSAVATHGTASWARIVANVTGRSENQCCRKWRHLSNKAAATDNSDAGLALGAAVSPTRTERENTRRSPYTCLRASAAGAPVKPDGGNGVDNVNGFGSTGLTLGATVSPSRTERENRPSDSAPNAGTARRPPPRLPLPPARLVERALPRKDAAAASSGVLASTDDGAWTVEEENNLVSAVQTFGTYRWTKVAVKVPDRDKTECYRKWWTIARRAAATNSGAWTVKEEKKLASAVDIYGGRNWAKVAANVPGRNEIQCCQRWHYLSRKAAATARGNWTVKEEKKLVSAVATHGTASWARIVANVPGRSENQCCRKWRHLANKAAATEGRACAWTVEEKKKLVSTVATFGTASWAKIAANVPGRSENQCYQKWWGISRKAAATDSGA
jgi:hypothetical protein